MWVVDAQLQKREKIEIKQQKRGKLRKSNQANNENTMTKANIKLMFKGWLMWFMSLIDDNFTSKWAKLHIYILAVM
jgi:hypothetical protein